jgi:hypothetical protein
MDTDFLMIHTHQTDMDTDTGINTDTRGYTGGEGDCQGQYNVAHSIYWTFLGMESQPSGNSTSSSISAIFVTAMTSESMMSPRRLHEFTAVYRYLDSFVQVF